MVVTSRGPEPGGPHENPALSEQPPARPPWRPRTMISDPAVTLVLNRATAAVNREARRRPALSAALVAAGLAAVVVSIAGPGTAAPEFRTPPTVVMATPSAQVTAAAKHTGLAPYEPPAPAEGPLSASPRASASFGPSGLPAPLPSIAGGDATVLSGVRELPPEKTPNGALNRTSVDPPGVSATPATASVIVGEPREGDSITAATSITGVADMPKDHQVWLLSRHGSSAYRIEGACRGDRSFVCGPATVESGGDDTFQLTAVVVDPATARGLQAGETRDVLPANLARSEVTVRRAVA
ncbi:hypothetical protein [Actinoplanes philippinensis]|uniref:hypothetical protein n=1 Tax=Actinoplanes philippinensis TaxID=35752 RepID=UPI0033F9B745